MSTSISKRDDIIDSRDIIARIEELEDELEAITEDNHPDTCLKIEQWHESDEGIELKELQALAAGCEGYSDWDYGAQLIKQDYFVQYIEELIKDCYEMPKMEGWPFQHLTMDYEAAANEAEQDYALVSFGKQDYWVRAC